MTNNNKTILVVDDSNAIIQLLTFILESTGYRVTTASSGMDALKILETLRPNIILLDVMMPGIDGFETCRQIKTIEDIKDIPLIFITGRTEGKDITKGFELGAVDYISKPIYPQEVQSRVNVHLKLQDLIETEKNLAKELDIKNRILVEEQHVAKEIFDKLVHTGCINLSNIKYWLSPMSIFNGDVILTNRHINGTLYICLGDFTGHGLPASIGVIPLADAFYSMTNKGFILQEIVHEINSKLYNNLPLGIFCASCILTLDLNTMKASVWNGSIPGVDLVSEDGKYESIKSKNLPLGILDDGSFNPIIEHIDLKENDRFYLYTDGIVEAVDANGNRYNFEQVYDAFKYEKPEKCFQKILDDLNEFTDGKQNDDITLLEVTVNQGDVTKIALKENKLN